MTLQNNPIYYPSFASRKNNFSKNQSISKQTKIDMQACSLQILNHQHKKTKKVAKKKIFGTRFVNGKEKESNTES